MRVMGWLFKDSRGMRAEMVRLEADGWEVRSTDTGQVYLSVPPLKMEEALGYAAKTLRRQGMDFRIDFVNAVRDD